MLKLPVSEEDMEKVHAKVVQQRQLAQQQTQPK